MDHDIIVGGNMITGVVTHQKKYNSDIKIIDGTGKYVIPGL
jgi:imidazolonepropionase-like amidohydrolase